MQTFQIKRGDTGPGIRYALQPSDVSLSGATVRFQMQTATKRETVIDQPASIVTAQPPVVEYAWQPGDTASAGRYEAEFRVEYTDGTVETFPNSGFISVHVNVDVQDAE